MVRTYTSFLESLLYKIQVAGFLNLEDEAAPGNQGLKDQVMALKWIQLNISNFGGNPKNVTIFGESSGGSCVNFLGISPSTKGEIYRFLFEKNIVFIGTKNKKF